MNHYIIMQIQNDDGQVIDRLIFDKSYKYIEACKNVAFLNEQSTGTNLSFIIRSFGFDLYSDQGIAKVARLKASICTKSILRAIFDLISE